MHNLARALASNLRDRKVLTDRGLRVGRIFDIIADENDGRLETLVIEPESQEITQEISVDEDGNALLPFSSVVAIKDYIIVSEKSLAIHRLKGT